MIERPIQWHDIIRGRDTAPPLLMLHGFLGSGADWMDVVDALSKRYRCICPDLPGHGSTHGVPANMRAFADAMLFRLDQLKIDSCAVLGYSLGGRLALYMAVHHPDRFGRVIIESAAPGLKSAEARAERLERDKELADTLERMADSPVAFAEYLIQWYDQPMFASMARREGPLQQLLDRRLRNRPADVAKVLVALSQGAQPSLWEALETYTTPTLAIVGELDRKYCFIAEAMSEASSHIAIHEVTDCGHNVHFEDQETFTKLVTGFLSPSAHEE